MEFAAELGLIEQCSRAELEIEDLGLEAFIDESCAGAARPAACQRLDVLVV